MANYTQPNGPRARLAQGRNRNTIQNIASKQDFSKLGDRSRLVKGGRSIDTSASTKKVNESRRPPTPGPSTVAKDFSLGQPVDFSENTAKMQQATQAFGQASNVAALVATLRATKAKTGGFGGQGGAVPKGVRAQLIKGFIEAGRPDLAKMVRTKAFDTWIGQESGWDADVVSPANNQGLRNGGLFQFWYGHDFSNMAEGNKRFNASPYQQAIWAATQFDLTPADIRNYARAIRQGTYRGWG